MGLRIDYSTSDLHLGTDVVNVPSTDILLIGGLVTSFFAATLLPERILGAIYYLTSDFRKSNSFFSLCFPGLFGRNPEPKESTQYLKNAWGSLALAGSKARMSVMFYGVLAGIILFLATPLSTVLKQVSPQARLPAFRAGDWVPRNCNLRSSNSLRNVVFH